MRLARARVRGATRAIRLTGEHHGIALDLPDSEDPIGDVLRADGHLDRLRTVGGHEVDMADVDLLAPLAHPGKIVAVGLNYTDHITETALHAPTRPLTFAKYPSSIVGPNAAVVVPDSLTSQPDYEAELTAVIGRRPDARPPRPDVVAYTVANDISARDIQFADEQWTRAKSFDTFTPLGPWLVTPDEFDDLATARIWTAVNGEILQDDVLGSMIFGIDDLLDFVGDGTTLEAGDLLLTGTPSGAGGFSNPPHYLAHGDVVEVAVAGIGTLTNTVVYRSLADKETTR